MKKIALFSFAVFCCLSGAIPLFGQEYLTGILQFELSFGADESNLPEQFLLATPWGMVVKNNGDIYVNDEKRIKVFDGNGVPKSMFGGPGDGPGEFGPTNLLTSLLLSPTDFLVVRHQRTHNIFNPDNSLMEMMNFENNKLRSNIDELFEFSVTAGASIYVLSPDEMVIFGSGRTYKENSSEIDRRFNYAAHKIGEEFFPIFESLSFGSNFGSRFNIPRFSYSLREFVLDKKLVYTITGLDMEINENDGMYTLHVYDLDMRQITDINQSFIPRKISDSEADSISNRYSSRGKDIVNLAKDKLKEIVYHSPLRDLLVDREFVFAFKTRPSGKGEIPTDIFDGISGKFLRSVYFPFIPRSVKNGNAYRITKNEDGFYIVEKYKIDPAVYAR